jgi:hypothetical protein
VLDLITITIIIIKGVYEHSRAQKIGLDVSAILCLSYRYKSTCTFSLN